MYFNQDISIVYPDVEKNVNVSFIEEIKLARFIKWFGSNGPYLSKLIGYKGSYCTVSYQDLA